MQPFSLAHMEALNILDCPAVSGGIRGWIAVDLFLAVCTSPTPLADLSSLASRRSLCVALLRTFRPQTLPRVLLEIDCYVRDYFTPPRLWEKDAEGKALAMPWIPRIIRCLCSHYGMTHAEAWATPAGYAFHLLITHLEAEGEDVQVFTAQDMAQEQALQGESLTP